MSDKYWHMNLAESERLLARIVERGYSEEVIDLYQEKIQKAAEKIMAGPEAMNRPWKLPDGSEAPCPRYQHDCDQCFYMGQFKRYDLWFCPSQRDPTGVNSIIGRHSSDGPDYYSAGPPEHCAGPAGYIAFTRGTYFEACMRVAVRAGLYKGKYTKEYK